MLRIVAFLGALLVAGPAMAQAQGQAVCEKRGEVMSHLQQKYSEAPVALGLANNGGIVEVLTDKGGKTWTIVITMPNGLSCLVAAGENWEKIPYVSMGHAT